MKRFTFLSLLAFSIPFISMAQNQNMIIDDIYYSPGNPDVQTAVKQINASTPKPNFVLLEIMKSIQRFQQLTMKTRML